MKPKEFTVHTMDEFQTMINQKNFSISEAIVNSILKNIKTRKKHIHVLSVKCTAENTVFDITLEKNNFIETLKENLVFYEKREMYEKCAEIQKAIPELTKI